MPLRFNMLLIDEGIDPSGVRLLRHQTRAAVRTPYSLWRDDAAAFEKYQSLQDPNQRALFAGPFWASFVVPPSGATLFVGLFEVRLIGSAPLDTVNPLTGQTGGSTGRSIAFDQYECRRVVALSEYVGRLWVDWGDSSRAWRQRAGNQDKLIVKLTRAFREEEFPGFMKFIRPLSELDSMPTAWKEVLRSSRGVYLLACPRTREHYVGSACGEDGFLGRWQEYAANLHGGNLGLLAREPSDYSISILEVAGSSATVNEIISMESTWKNKLQSRDIGLNRN